MNGRLPTPEPAKQPDLEYYAQLLKKAGIEIKPGSPVKEYQEAIKKLTVRNAEELGVTQAVHTPELMALRCSIASTMVMREAGIPVEQPEGAPVKSWANSIRHDPSQLSKAARDGNLVAEAVLVDMGKNREAELFRAAMERAEAQKGQELAAEAAAIPRGLDSNLRNADLSGVQEAVIEAADKAATQVNDLRASATTREANAHEAGTGIDKIAAARNVAKQNLGDSATVISAQPGHTYSGKIIGILGGLTSPENDAIQAISDNQAVLHDIKNISDKSILKVGEDVSLAVDEQGYSAVRDSKTQSQKREGHKR